MATALGCDGKWAIHPDQLEIINQLFSPSPDDIARAKKIIDAGEEFRKTGKGAIAVEGRMVDQATLRLAEQLWSRAKYLNLI